MGRKDTLEGWINEYFIDSILVADVVFKTLEASHAVLGPLVEDEYTISIEHNVARVQ